MGWQTLQKILTHEEPPGYRQQKPPPWPKLGPFLGIIHQVLPEDRQAPKKPRHTAQRIWERLREEHGFTGCYSSVKEAMRE